MAATTVGAELVAAEGAAAMSAVSEASWWRMVSAGKAPAPVHLNKRLTRWRVAELRAWIAAGCPDRATWEQMRAA